MKRLITLLMIVLAVAFALSSKPIGIKPVFAQARFGARLSAAVQTETALLLPAGTWVYGLKIYADAANSFMGIYNAATLPACTNATVMDEIGEATQYDTAEKRYVQPVYFSAGVSVVMQTGVGWVEYGPEP